MKKTYSKPKLVTREVKLGVFGDYGREDDNVVRDGVTKPGPVDEILPTTLRME